MRGEFPLARATTLIPLMGMLLLAADLANAGGYSIVGTSALPDADPSAPMPPGSSGNAINTGPCRSPV